MTNVCGYPTEARALRDDLAEDFAMGTLEGAIVEPGGFVGPVPYLISGVRTAGIMGDQLRDNADATYEELAQLPVAGSGVVRGVDIDFDQEIPYELGLTASDDITVLVEGEIYLDAVGVHEFELRANDRGFIDMAPPGSTQYTRLITSVGNDEFYADYDVQQVGWHRFRGALADFDQFLEWELRYDPPGVQTMRSIPDDRVRARVDDRSGMVVDGSDEYAQMLGVGTALVEAPYDIDFPGEPYGMPTGSGSFGLRWTGQVLLDVGGSYSFRIESVGGHRVWFGGELVANVLGEDPEETVTDARELEPGWYDVVIDLWNNDGGPTARMEFAVDSGPQFAGEPFPADHVRPVSGRVARFATARNDTVTAIPDGTSATRTLGLDLPSGYEALAVEVLFEIFHPMQSTFSMVLDPSVGSNLTLVGVGTLSGTTSHFQIDSIPLDRAGSSYQFIAADSTVDMVVGEIEYVSVSMVYTGGRPPFEPMAIFTSSVRELDAARLGPMTWSVRQPTLDPTVSVRTCDEAAECETARWVPVAHGETPAVPARKYFQYKVEIANSEDVPTSLDWIELQYVGYLVP